MGNKYLLLLLMSISTVISNAQNRSFEQLRQEFLNASSGKILIAAHRGAHLNAPENSLQAFQESIDMGIDIIELDVRCTRDGQLVVIHDKTVDRTTNGKGAVDSLTFDQIRKLRLMFNGRLTNQQVPTLQEALMLTKGKILVDLDIKSVSCIDKIMQEVKAAGAEGSCFFFVTKADQVKLLKQRDAAFSTLLRTSSEKDVKAALGVVKTEAIHIDTSHNSPVVISLIRSAGARVWINALGEIDSKAAAGNVEAFESLLVNGANIIQTDQPALLKQYLKSTDRYW